MANKTERKLTKAEEARKERFEQTVAEMESKGYKMHSLTISVLYANIMAIVLCLPIIAVFGLAFLLKDHSNAVEPNYILASVSLMVVIIVLFVVHELIHGITWAIFAENHWKSISFGFIVKALTPYCTCNSVLTKWQYIAGAAMPLILLGILPSAVAVATGSEWLLMIGSLMIFGGGGDLIMILKLLRFKSSAEDVRYLDHPYNVGLVAFEK